MGLEVGIPIALGMASLGGSMIAAGSAESTNSQSMAFSSAENEKAREWQEKMYGQQVKDTIASEGRANTEYDRRFQMQNEEYAKRLGLSSDLQKQLTQYLYESFNSPEARRDALLKAGLNPSVLLGGSASPFGEIGLESLSASEPSFGSPSASSIPSAGSSPTASANLKNPYEGFDFGVSNLSSALLNLAGAEKTSTENQQMKDTFDLIKEGMVLDNASKETKNAYDNLVLKIKEAFGDKQAAADVTATIASAYRNFMNGDNEKAQADINSVLKNMYERQDKIDALAKVDIEFWANNMIRSADQEYQLKVIQGKIGKSEIAKNYADANRAVSMSGYYAALTKTEDALRSGRVEMQDLQNDLMTVEKFLKGNELYISDKTKEGQIQMFFTLAEKAGIETKQLQAQLNNFLKWGDRQAYAQYVNSFISSFSQAVGAVGGTYNGWRSASLQRLSAKERNDIKAEFNRIFEQKVNNISNRQAGVGSIMEHVPDDHAGYYEPYWQNR